MGRIGQKLKKHGALGLKVAGTGLAIAQAFNVGQKAGEMSDNAEDQKQERARDLYLSGNSEYAGVSDYVRTGKLTGPNEGFEF